MKLVKVCNEPRIWQNTDKWGVPNGTYSVNFFVGHIGEDLYDRLREFEDFPYDDAIAGKVFTNEEFQEKVDKLLGYTGGYTTYQYNVRVSVGKDDTSTYVRSISALGVKGIQKYSILTHIKAKLLGIKAWFKSRFKK